MSTSYTCYTEILQRLEGKSVPYYSRGGRERVRKEGMSEMGKIYIRDIHVGIDQTLSFRLGED